MKSHYTQKFIYHKGCSIIFHGPYHKTHPDKALRKVIYILLFEIYVRNQCEFNRFYGDIFVFVVLVTASVIKWNFHMFLYFYNDFHVHFSIDEV